MRRKVLLVALALGTVIGYAKALSHHHHQRLHRGSWKQQVADVCVEAARQHLTPTERGAADQ